MGRRRQERDAKRDAVISRDVLRYIAARGRRTSRKMAATRAAAGRWRIRTRRYTELRSQITQFKILGVGPDSVGDEVKER